MIENIITTFRKQAREHKTIRAFYYNRNYELGAGNESHPLLWLEDPIAGRNNDNLFVNSVNFSVLFIPTSNEAVAHMQHLAFSIGLNMIERIKKDPASGFTIRPDWTYTTLRNYYDNNACGCRFSLNMNQVNMQNLCLIEEQFDTDKEFEDAVLLPEISLPGGKPCEIFENKLPDFDIKTRKK